MIYIYINIYEHIYNSAKFAADIKAASRSPRRKPAKRPPQPPLKIENCAIYWRINTLTDIDILYIYKESKNFEALMILLIK